MEILKRPVFMMAIGSIIGIILGVYLKESIPFLIIVLIILGICKLKDKAFYNIFLFLFFLISFAFYTIRLEQKYSQKYQCFEHKNVTVVGTIVSDIEEKEYKYVFHIKVKTINGNKTFQGDKLLVYIPKKDFEITLNYADSILFTGEFSKGNVARNYQGFDYQFYLKSKKNYGIVSVEQNTVRKIKQNDLNVFAIWNHKIEKTLEKRLQSNLPQKTANLEIGILLGYSREIDSDIQKAFQDSNITHMLAVSGENTMYVILMISWIFRKKIFSNQGQKMISILMIWWFVKLTGSTLSVIRAGLTSIIYLAAGLFHRKADIITTISLATLLSILPNPFHIFDIGMQLSYAGTISILLFYQSFFKKSDQILQNWNTKKLRKKVIQFFIENILLTFSANILIFPLMMYHFNTISLTFLFSNFLIGPLVGIATIMGFAVIGCSIFPLSISKLLGKLLHLLLSVIIKAAEYFAKLKVSKIYIITPNFIEIMLIYAGIGIGFYLISSKQEESENEKKNKKIVKYFLNVLCLYLLFCIVSNLIPSNQLQIHFVDVGQGDCCLMITPHHKKILVDGGGSMTPEIFDIGEKTLVPYLLDRRIKIIDYVIISHFDSDHIGGLFAVMEKLHVKKVIIPKQEEDSENYQKFQEITKKKNIKVLVVSQETQLQVEQGISIEFLWPDAQQIITENILNNNSLVCKLNYQAFSVLFTGDIEMVAERAILQKYQSGLSKLKATVLKVGHHGSKTSSTQELINAVKPKIALIGVGEKNKFGHPNTEVLGRLESCGAKIYRTDQMGEISIVVSKRGKMKIKKQV